MKKNLTFLLSIFSIFQLVAQPTLDYAVQTWAEIETTPAKITINWLEVNGTDNYFIYRKEKTETSWGSLLATLDADATFYEDTNVEVEVSYEYKVEKTGNVPAFGYINAGIEISPVHHRGTLLLLVDSLFIDGLADELSQLMEDMVGDGWVVIRRDVNREGTVAEIKQIVLDEYNAAAQNLDAIFCLGHVPVPYAGNYAPDGHVNNHEGAWPADGYYGEIDGTWTDVSVTNITAAQERNHNIPGDGKFDQTFLPSDLEMQIGRVDFANMPAFSSSEEELLRLYLNKNHAYKIGQVQVEMKAIIDDNFGGFSGEAFAGAAWKSCAPMLHPDNIANGDYRTSMDTASYIWSYGCGGGSYSSCNGVGTTTEISGDSLQGIFSALFGSYFGDWDSQNNLMRATLAQGNILTNCWNGRPHWYFHHMGLGENIGYSAKSSMNNNGTFYNTPLSFLGRLTSMGLMGDPTLRMYVLQPASNLTATFTGFDMELNWTASTDADVGYFIYRSQETNSHYTLLNDEPILATTFIDECIDESATYYYMVRATKLETTPSGSFHNLSQGVFANEDATIQSPTAFFSTIVNSDSLFVENTSTLSTTWLWNFGDGMMSNEFQPTHVFQTPGDYEVVLIVSNECFQDTFSIMVSILFTNTYDLVEEAGISVFPNPGEHWFTINSNKKLSKTKLRIYNSLGEMVRNIPWGNSENTISFSLKAFPAGVYFVRIQEGNNIGVLKIMKQ